MDDYWDGLRDEYHDKFVESIELELRSFLEVNPETNALDYLERAVQFILEADTNPMAWKWVVLAAYGALYGFCISTLRGTNADLVRQKDSKNIIDFDTALRRCQLRKFRNYILDTRRIS